MREMWLLLTSFVELLIWRKIGGETLCRTLTLKKKRTIMIFEVGNLYYVYNQGNNRQKTFFSNDNYLYFLTKMKTHILPHADILII